jgi:hypothetical protein
MICVSLPIPTNNRNACNQQRQQEKTALDVITPFARRSSNQKQEQWALLLPWRNNDVYARDFKSM